MWADIFQVGLIVSILATAVRMGTIVLLGALGELVAERAGVLNLSVEGMMLTGAFAGFLQANRIYLWRSLPSRPRIVAPWSAASCRSSSVLTVLI